MYVPPLMTMTSRVLISVHSQLLELLRDSPILVIGAGGLGCEVLYVSWTALSWLPCLAVLLLPPLTVVSLRSCSRTSR